MRFHSFEPGDGTRYLVGLARLSAGDIQDTGLGEVFFTFGPARPPLQGWVFRDSHHAGLLTYEYFADKMGADSVYNLCAAYHVACAVLDRPSGPCPIPLEEMGWKEDWREELLGWGF